MAESIVTSRGRITIPVKVRRALGLRARDRVVLTVMPDGTALLSAKTRSVAKPTRALKPAARIAVKAMRIGRN